MIGDGFLRILMLVMAVQDTATNYCPTETGCFPLGSRSPRVGIAGGAIYRDGQAYGSEIMLRYDLRRTYGPFGTAVGLSYADDNSLWIGYGLTYDVTVPNPYYIQFYALPGLQKDGDIQSGGALKFRAGAEAGLELRNGVRIGLAFDHRSGGVSYEPNPGIEAWMLKVSIER